MADKKDTEQRVQPVETSPEIERFLEEACDHEWRKLMPDKTLAEKIWELKEWLEKQPLKVDEHMLFSSQEDKDRLIAELMEFSKSDEDVDDNNEKIRWFNTKEFKDD